MNNSNVRRHSILARDWGCEMTMQYTRNVRGVMLDRHTTFSISEFCRACGADREFVQALITEGIIDPLGESSSWRFHGEALVRAQRARRLMHDLGINLPGVALVLDLLDEVEALRRNAGWERRRR